MNKKGFTLVELLGVMVLLSVLMMIAIPGISNLVKKNKDKVYVQDAKKLISLAEYKVKSSQNKYIKKPKTDECIILTLGYLNDGTLDTTPNNDEYLKDASYVMVTNIGSDYQYYVTLIEKYKGAYKGIDNATLDQLKSRTYETKVFKDDEVFYINSAAKAASGNTSGGVIPNRLGEFKGKKIVGKYND